MVRAVAEIVMRTMSAAEYDNRAELSVTIVCEQIYQRFVLPFRYVSAVKQTIQHLCRRLGCLSPQYEYSSRKFLIMIEVCILD